MLKIKDGIDLSELQKFGFVEEDFFLVFWRTLF